MVQLQDVRDNVAQALGLRRSAWDRLRDRLPTVDLASYMPGRTDLRGYVPTRVTGISLDTTSLVIGLVAGIGLGVSLGYLLKGNVKPTVQRARERAREIPARLNITRMEEVKR